MTMLVTEELLPKDIFVMYFAEERSLAEFIVYSRGNPYVVSDLIELFKEYDIVPLSCNISRIREYYTILVFADFTNAKITPSKLKDKISDISGIEKVSYIGERVHGLMFDELSFPITTNMGKSRAIILLVSTFSDTLKRMKSEWGSGAEAFLYYLGYDMGYDCARIFRQEIKYYREEIMEVLKVIQALGWGRIKKLELDFDRKRGRLIILDLFESETSRGQFAVPKCHFFRGFLAGFLSQLLEVNIKVAEVRCIAKGDPHCEFVFEPGST